MYYIVIIGWCGKLHALLPDQGLGRRSQRLFFTEFLKVPFDPSAQAPAVEKVWGITSFRWPIAIAVGVIWLVNWTIAYGGVEKGMSERSR